MNGITQNVLRLAVGYVGSLQVDGSSVVDDDDLLVITSDSDDDDNSCSQTPARNTSNVTARDEIPDVWDGFEEGCAAAFDPVASPLQVIHYCQYISNSLHWYTHFYYHRLCIVFFSSK